MKSSKSIKSEIEKLKEELAKAEAKERLADREKLLEKRPTSFPPGFELKWRHRHDPFDSYWRLSVYAKNGEEILSWEIDDAEDTEIQAREYAWSMFDSAVEICKVAGLIK